MYLSVRIYNLDILAQNREERPPQKDAASTAQAAPGRVGRDEQGREHRANTTWKGGAYFELGRLRVKSWSKSDFSIADAPWPTNLYIHLLTCRLTKIPVREQRRECPRGGTNFPSTFPKSTAVASANRFDRCKQYFFRVLEAPRAT